MLAVKERDEASNGVAADRPVDVTLPDLRPRPCRASRGQRCLVAGGGGNGAERGLMTRYYLLANPVQGGVDILLTGGRTVGELGVNGVSTAHAAITVPCSTASGVYHVLASADGLAVVKELSETSSCRLAGTTATVMQ